HSTGLLADAHSLEAALLCTSHCSGTDSPRRRPRNHADANRYVGPRDLGESLKLGVRSQCSSDIFRGIGPLDSGIHALCILTKNGCVDFRLVKFAIGPLPNIVQRIPLEGDAWSHADIQIKFLPHGDDWAVINVALAAEFGLKFCLCLLIRF